MTPHTLFDDLQGLLTGALFVALGVYFLKSAALLTGGTAGTAFLLHYLFDLNYGSALFVINLPFYYFGYRVMGVAFTLKTFVAVALLSAFVEVLPALLVLDHLNPFFAALMGGLLAGTGILILVRHGASLGGVTITAIYLQKTRRWRAGWVQMGIDALIMLGGVWLLNVETILISLIGVVALNMVIAVNHREGRYFTV